MRASVYSGFSPMLRLYLLGSFRLERDGQTVRLSTRKVASLLAYLALLPRPHTREKLAALLWGEVGDAQARASLRNALPAIKKQLGPERLSVDRETVALDTAGLWVDALEFRAQVEALLAAGLPNPASIEMDLYRGDLLSDFYDEWIAPEREGLRHLYLKALLRLAHGWQAQGEYRRALHWVEVLLAAESASEAAYQLQIACYLALGDSEAALRQYEACERALRDELGIEPAAETRALYTRLRQPPTRPQPAAALGNLPLPLTSFIGRQAAVAAVRSLLEGGARLLTLTGPGGCGKTRLAIQVAAEVAPGLAEGAWWVELAALADPGLVPATVARTLGLRESPNEPAEAQLLRHLRTGRYLLVLDNCEHLLRACAELAVRLLPACPGLQCLCTSREPLGLTGEISWPLPRLAVSGDKARLEAVQLFVERAAAARLAGARRAGQPARHPGDAAAGHPALQRGRGDGPGAGRRLTWIGRLSRRRGEFNYAEWEIILEPRSSATHLRQRFHYHPQTAVEREMLRALGDSQGIAAACAVSLQKLKRRLEAHAANGLPQPA